MPTANTRPLWVISPCFLPFAFHTAWKQQHTIARGDYSGCEPPHGWGLVVFWGMSFSPSCAENNCYFWLKSHLLLQFDFLEKIEQKVLETCQSISVIACYLLCKICMLWVLRWPVVPFPEPDVASSDATNMECTLHMDEDSYVINGKKWWSSGMSFSLLVI